MSDKCGSLVFATRQGLGILAKSFFDHGIVTDVHVMHHGKRRPHLEWYPPGVGYGNGLDAAQAFASKMDLMLFFETPFHWELIPFCRERGIKTVIMPMHECMPREIPHQPDLWLCPSLLDVQWSKGYVGDGAGTAFLPVPVEVPWRQRTKAEVFIHNAGHGGLRGRNGTKELLQALQYVKSPARFIIRSQEPISFEERQSVGLPVYKDRLKFECFEKPYEDLFKDGDVFVFPEKFNGLSLPLQEARAAGMLVMATDRFPMNTWLPGAKHSTSNDDCPLNDPETFANPATAGLPCRCSSPLIPVAGYNRSRVAARFGEFEEAIVDPQAIAAKIDEWWGRDITDYSLSGKAWAETMSWQALGPQYRKVLEELCE